MNPSNKRTVVVTGGMGFIGSAFLRRVVPAYPDIRWINLDDMRAGSNEKAVESIRDLPNYVHVKAAIEDKDQVDDVFKFAEEAEIGVTDVIHLAAESDVDRSIKDGVYTAGVNVMGTLHLLEAARRQGNFKRFVYVSTDEIYGPVKSQEQRKKEGDLMMPTNPYSAAKASAEHFCYSYVNTHNMDCVITRGSNTFGPWQDYTKMIPVAMKALREGNKIPLYGDGMQMREWLPVDLHAEGIEAVWLRGETGHVYNIGTGFDMKNIDLAKTLIKAVKAPDTSYKFVDDRPGHDRRYAIDNEKLRSIGWPNNPDHLSATYVNNQIAETARWYYQQPTLDK